MKPLQYGNTCFSFDLFFFKILTEIYEIPWHLSLLNQKCVIIGLQLYSCCAVLNKKREKPATVLIRQHDVVIVQLVLIMEVFFFSYKKTLYRNYFESVIMHVVSLLCASFQKRNKDALRISRFQEIKWSWIP